MLLLGLGQILKLVQLIGEKEAAEVAGAVLKGLGDTEYQPAAASCDVRYQLTRERSVVNLEVEMASAPLEFVD
ncbi:hypothetical protein EBBID32_3860 [Sphingobium indicum BiD32]|uniref:Uncharacterized protein n=1 Tax=Sphingobium indicum BiD32 TaxID=1301087 RepID=N1MFP7_9SPHN|nr:hypothetical protein EBBID32_3860 [Sphingobium indicum BiD32]